MFTHFLEIPIRITDVLFHHPQCVRRNAVCVEIENSRHEVILYHDSANGFPVRSNALNYFRIKTYNRNEKRF